MQVRWLNAGVLRGAREVGVRAAILEALTGTPSLTGRDTCEPITHCIL
jgi:hypothetical protein